MSAVNPKPLNWIPDPYIGYKVARRPDGGMLVTFSDTSEATLLHWRQFALQHLEDSDRLTRNLYDLRQVNSIPETAIRLALEANSDPSTRNLRVAVVVANETVRQAVEKITALTTAGGAEIKIFSDIDIAEAWLSRPLESTL